MSIAGHGSPSIEPMSLPHGPGTRSPIPNLDVPSQSGNHNVRDHSDNELAPDGFKSSPLPPHKRRKTAPSSSAISAVFSSSSVSQASPPLKRPRTLKSASFVGGDVPLRSDSNSSLDWASSPKHALGLTLLNAGPSKSPYILPLPLTSDGAAPSTESTMPNRRHGEYPEDILLLNARPEKRTYSEIQLGEFDPPGISRRHEDRHSTGTSTSPSFASSVSRPSGGRSIRTSTQLLTKRSKARAELGEFGANYVGMGGIRTAFLKPAEGPTTPAYRATAHELELWTDANVSPLVFGERKFAARLPERKVKEAVTFNLRYLLQDMGQLSSGPQTSEGHPSLTAIQERSRKNRIAFILQDVLGSESQTPTEETDDGFSTDVPNNLQGDLDTYSQSTDTDDHSFKVPIRSGYEPHLKPALYNTNSLSFRQPRRSFLPPIRNTPSSTTVKKDVIREYTSNLLPNASSISTQNNIQSTRSPASHVHETTDASISSLSTPGKEYPAHTSKEFSEGPAQAPKGPVPAVREPSVGAIELLSLMIVDEDPNVAHSPPTATQPPIHENLISMDSQPPRKDLSRPHLLRDDSTPSSLFGNHDAPESSIASPPPSDAFLPQTLPGVPAPSSLSSETDLDIHANDLPASSGRRFFHECLIQSPEDASNSSAKVQGIVFRSSTNPSNVRFLDIAQWPSPAAPEDHPYFQEARTLMVIAKLREDISPVFAEDDELESENDEDSRIGSESEIEDEDELDGSENADSIESSGTHDELDTLSVLPTSPAASGRHDMSLARWDAHTVTPARGDQGLHHRVDGWESISTSQVRGPESNTEHQPVLVPPIALSLSRNDRGSDHAGDEDDQINHEDQLEDWTASLQTLVKGKRVLLPEELLNLKTVLNAVYTHAPTISASSELAQIVLQVAKLEAKDIPNQDSLGLRALARKSVRAWGLSTRTKP